MDRPRTKLATSRSQVRRPNHYTTEPPLRPKFLALASPCIEGLGHGLLPCAHVNITDVARSPGGRWKLSGPDYAINCRLYGWSLMVPRPPRHPTSGVNHDPRDLSVASSVQHACARRNSINSVMSLPSSLIIVSYLSRAAMRPPTPAGLFGSFRSLYRQHRSTEGALTKPAAGQQPTWLPAGDIKGKTLCFSRLIYSCTCLYFVYTKESKGFRKRLR